MEPVVDWDTVKPLRTMTDGELETETRRVMTGLAALEVEYKKVKQALIDARTRESQLHGEHRRREIETHAGAGRQGG